jgi:hypothetical protein
LFDSIRFDSLLRSPISLADQPQGLRCRPGDQNGDMASSAADGVQRYELAEATSTTSPRQFQFELYKRRTTVLLPRDLFLDLVCDARPRPLQVCCPQPARRSNARLQVRLPSPTPLQRHASAPDFVLSTFPNLFLFYYTYLRKSHFELLNLLSGKFVCN